MKNLILIWLFITVIFYAAGSVAEATFNPYKWQPQTNAVVPVFWVIVTLLLLVGYIYRENEQNKKN